MGAPRAISCTPGKRPSGWIPTATTNKCRGQKNQSGKDKQKKNLNKTGSSNSAESKEKMDVDFTEYSQSMCYNCGDPGHPQTECGKPKLYFICKSATHAVSECPVRKRPHQMAKFVGRAAEDWDSIT